MKGEFMQKMNLFSDKTGDFEFDGHKVASVSSSPVDNRWHELTIFCDVSGRYILLISYHTNNPNEKEASYIEVSDKMFSLLAMLGQDAQKYTPEIKDENKEFIRKVLIPLGASFSAACSKLTSDVKGFTQAEVTEEIK
jgi:hypothetical protein